MSPSTISRRQFLLGGIALQVVRPEFAAAQPSGTSDHGIGGSGLSIQGGGENEDHGIGGTGIVGTIQGFGSIIVNNVHIPFSETTPIEIDGRRAPASAMKVGHVARVLLTGKRAARIAIVSEVQGRIDRIDKTGITILSQTVDTTGLVTKGLRKGNRVAVFGIRKPDGTIIARRIEPRSVSDGAHVRGVPSKSGHRVRIGGLSLGSTHGYLVGKQTLVRLRTVADRLMIIRIQAEPVVPGLKRGIVNVETFRSADKGGAGSGPGGSAPYGSMRMSPDGHGFVDVTVRDSSRMMGFPDTRGPDGFGPRPPDGPPDGPPHDRPSFGRGGPGGDYPDPNRRGPPPRDTAPRSPPPPDFPGPR
ncbi:MULTISPECIES: DUF5666 domain-containing protein [Rhizobium]|uniref:DUF5666 domain-containing protein n=1 Tax=Rhizobium TaxID=379 RepID=UPI000FEC8177|nr:DUF5666 domain-containing protein [Rhizobium leguminosarum]RWX19173.1 hypothetical protein EHI45_01245 [Rhizobium leguminosarum]UIJ83796.1 DUF5666 domain-containing protein [Rhizobium leguminosarum]